MAKVEIGAKFAPSPEAFCSRCGRYWERLPKFNADELALQRALLLDLPIRVEQRLAAIQTLRKTDTRDD